MKHMLVVLLLCPTLAQAADWQQFMRDAAHTGDAASEELRLPLGLLAQVKLDDAVLTSPAVVGGRAYVVDQMGTAYCIDPKAGRVIWKAAPDGAAAKGNTLLNFAGVRPHLLPYVVDKNPAKQGKYMPGSRIPIVDEAYLRAQQPRYVLILPWNLQAEVMEQLAYIRDWGGRFITAVPGLVVWP